ncbi:polynucleotide kinase 3 phosphatase-domain-containing protein [Blyttiomyces helicus]|uniref:Polynucleotide kinase 3 phosphatase-domain-containing protein n=1 Tax=Blyttiomyces helicus TaxID=388810 RepID=A0A4P9WHT1_9FUNG|nr:polynucleotide kinase 3 phosphatase-domain-containing protein [Blyttiomyces helicus]|eukprot:RKO91403.1 polynucleotide kinase 3 phosphatase-domain-containing protein [Blyttiomyces helicus]
MSPPKRSRKDSPPDDSTDDEQAVSKRPRRSDPTSALPIHPFFTGGSTKPASRGPVQWTEKSTLLIGVVGTQDLSRTSIAGFDFDGTIVTVKGSHVHAKNADDWKFFSTSVPERLLKAHEDGFRVVIFSNQKGILEGRSSAKQAFVGRVENVVKALETHCRKESKSLFPVLVLAGCGNDWFRKPRLGMWDHVEEEHRAVAPLDRSRSFYVGDAAGRPAAWMPGHKKDFADTDLKFAINVGIAFHVPEAYFPHPAPVVLPPVPIVPFPHSTHLENEVHYTPTTLPLIPENRDANHLDLVILTGFPASGKSSFARRFLGEKGYAIVNQDTLKTRPKCIAATKNFLLEGKNVVVDNTNPTRDVRQLYIEAAPDRLTVTVRSFMFTAPQELCVHNMLFRSFGQPRPRKHIPSVAFATFAKNLEVPTTAEGFHEVKSIRFVAEFRSDEEKRMWSLHYS